MLVGLCLWQRAFSAPSTYTILPVLAPMEPPAAAGKPGMSQQRFTFTLSQQLEGTMSTPDQSPPLQLNITGGQGGHGGQGYSHGTGGVGGVGMGPTVNITAQQLNLSTFASEQASQQRQMQYTAANAYFFFTSDTKTQKIYLLHGLGGAGKTQIALKFIKESSSRFSNVFFIDTSTITTIDKGLKNIAVIKSCGDSQQDGLLWLTSNIEDWLLLFDNADDPSINLQDFIPECDHGNMIITSRNPGLCVYAGSDSLVSDMEEKDAVILLLKSAAQKVTAATEQIATEIVKVR
ncbi:Kinesin light chain [Mycena sanguinolenta]|uniref:Kinesin light chain n=1 Tax=Mycena sanguinolenta TaxID=230812 RepID=A0A8H6XIP9_9AGAR|nr:Kinesin light chain [Mycena sanguinolenta]